MPLKYKRLQYLDMEVTGKIIRVFEPVSGVSKTGNSWKKREYLLEVPNGQYPRQIFFNFFGDRADQFVLTGGREYRISFDLESREFNGRWYTDVRAWKAENPDGTPLTGTPSAQQAVAGQPGGFGAPVPPPPSYAADPFASAPAATVNDNPDSATDDLPF